MLPMSVRWEEPISLEGNREYAKLYGLMNAGASGKSFEYDVETVECGDSAMSLAEFSGESALVPALWRFSGSLVELLRVRIFRDLTS